MPMACHHLPSFSRVCYPLPSIDSFSRFRCNHCSSLNNWHQFSYITNNTNLLKITFIFIINKQKCNYICEIIKNENRRGQRKERDRRQRQIGPNNRIAIYFNHYTSLLYWMRLHAPMCPHIGIIYLTLMAISSMSFNLIACNCRLYRFLKNLKLD